MDKEILIYDEYGESRINISDVIAGEKVYLLIMKQ